MAVKDDLGKVGEEIAVQFLTDKGLVVLRRNWRCSEGEIDIVAVDNGDTLVICEVKTRRNTRLGPPVAAVTRAKRRKLRRLAYLWLAAMGTRHWPQVRFDVVGIILPQHGIPQINHIERAF